MPKYIFAIVLSLVSVLVAQNSHPANDRKIQVQDVIITGTRSIDSTELDEIAGVLTGKTINEDEEELKDRLRFAFADHGYMKAEIESASVKAIDPLAHPKPVVVEAVVNEGPRFKFGEVSFSGNHAIESDQLKAEFPFHKDELFNRSKIGKGLDSLRELYSKQGYINMTPLPNVEITSDAVDLKIDIDEGRQYRMGTLEFGGNTNVADKLRTRWKLEPGQPFDQTYIQRFVDENSSLLPATFDLHSSIKYARDCKSSKVNLLIDLDPEHPSKPPQDVPCETNKRDANPK